MTEPHAPQFNAEERDLLVQLERSRGWHLLITKLAIPRIQFITQTLDRPHIEQQGHGDFLRGEKRAYYQLIDLVYRATGQRNPFDQHALGLLRALDHAVGIEPVAMSELHGPPEEMLIQHPARKPKSFPV